MDRTIKTLVIVGCCLFILIVVFLFFLLDINLRDEDANSVDTADDVGFVGIVDEDTIIDCSADIYNCDNFGKCSDVMRVFDMCMNTTGADVHRLDVENDGIPCENLC